MPELLVLLSCFGFVAYRVAVTAERRRRKSPAEIAAEVERLRLRRSWLRERIERAESESWGADAVRNLRGQLDDAERDLAALEAARERAAADQTAA